MSKVDVYLADYVVIDDVNQQESERLASNECMVGSPLTLRATDEPGAFEVLSPAGNPIGRIRPSNRLAFRDALENGWTTRCWLSLVYYVENEKTFRGELVYQFHRVKSSQVNEQEALDAFEEGVSEMLAAGKRPRVKITGNEYDEVISSKGAWRPAEEEPLPFSTKRGSGMVVFKRKRSLSDKLTIAAINNKPGCRIALTVAIIVVAALVLFLIWRCTH